MELCPCSLSLSEDRRVESLSIDLGDSGIWRTEGRGQSRALWKDGWCEGTRKVTEGLL